MFFLSPSTNVLLFLGLIRFPSTHAGYRQESESEYLRNFASHMASSYAAIDDPGMTSRSASSILQACQEKEWTKFNKLEPGSMRRVQVKPALRDTVLTTQEVEDQCGERDVCVIPPQVTLRMTSSLHVGALIVQGRLVWSQDTMNSQSEDLTTSTTRKEPIPLEDTVLCAGYVAIEQGGEFYMDLTSKDLSSHSKRRAWIYLQNNGAKHDILKTRAFGGVGPKSKIEVIGRPLARSWSLLDTPLDISEDRLKLLHHPGQMGWKIGDRIGIAPTEKASKGTGQTFTIMDIDEADGAITLDRPSLYHHGARFLPPPQLTSGNAPTNADNPSPALLSAEVVNLSRDIIITGDDFEQIPCDPTLTDETQGCVCTSYRSTCTMGLHTILAHAPEGSLRMSYVRVEKCGQRGIMGKYCLHFHKNQDCPDCMFHGNAIETSHARGIIIHDTHRTLVQENVLWNVRGAGIYVEDGNEMYNSIQYNVVICPFSLYDSVQNGCTIPGTSNRQSDTRLNQAGYYLTSSTNDLIGNRAANSFNGMFNEPKAEGDALNRVLCPKRLPIGRWEGNTFHGHGRFGTYAIDIYPQDTDRTIATNGYHHGEASCVGFDSQGNTSGRSSTILNNVDFDNSFVGQYDAGDLQYKGHISIDNNNLIYWKETKNFQDGCSAHFSQSYYARGDMALPDQATVILEDTVLEDVVLQANHHCQIGTTGFLCMPQYILHNILWKRSNEEDIEIPWVSFQKGSTNFGGIFSLSPDSDPDSPHSPFPRSYVSLVSSFYEYLLADPDGSCLLSSELGLEKRYDGGILCQKPLRALKIYSRGLELDGRDSTDLLVEVWFNSDGINSHTSVPSISQIIPYHQIGDDGRTDKQGFAFPVVPSREVSYRVSLAGNQKESIPNDWVVEFSDPVMGNRWDAEFVQLDLKDRFCGYKGLVSSQHDRRFLYSGLDFMGGDAWGSHGACVDSPDIPPPDMPPIDCAATDDARPSELAQVTACPEMCSKICDSENSYCDCRTATCVCKAGLSGPECSHDLCQQARCGNHGTCAARYLGGAITAVTSTQNACICDDGWFGPLCDQPVVEMKVSASSGERPPEDAIDGSLSTRWESDSADNQWFGIDLGQTHELSLVEIAWGRGYAQEFDVSLSDDGSSWKTAYSEEDGQGGTEAFNITGSAQHVRISIARPGSKYSYSIKEIQIRSPTDVLVPACDCEILSDCLLPGLCQPGGYCSTPIPMAMGTPCNSVPDGRCTFGVCESPETNEASPKAYASSSMQSPQNVLEKGRTTRWESDFGDDQWLVIDLRRSMRLEAAELHWEDAYGKKYDIQVSGDGVIWTTAFSEVKGSGGVDLIDLDGYSGRYVRMVGIERGTPWGYSLYEMVIVEKDKVLFSDHPPDIPSWRDSKPGNANASTRVSRAPSVLHHASFSMATAITAIFSLSIV